MSLRNHTNEFRLFEYNVLDVCATLHASNTGSGDYLPDDEFYRLASWLKWRIANWYATSRRLDATGGQYYDDSVRALALATLLECQEARPLTPAKES